MLKRYYEKLSKKEHEEFFKLLSGASTACALAISITAYIVHYKHADANTSANASNDNFMIVNSQTAQHLNDYDDHYEM